MKKLNYYERDAMLEQSIEFIKQKYGFNRDRASVVLMGMMFSLINDSDLELILTVAQKERD